MPNAPFLWPTVYRSLHIGKHMTSILRHVAEVLYMWLCVYLCVCVFRCVGERVLGIDLKLHPPVLPLPSPTSRSRSSPVTYRFYGDIHKKCWSFSFDLALPLVTMRKSMARYKITFYILTFTYTLKLHIEISNAYAIVIS